MIPVVVIVSRLSVTLSSQFFETSDCTPPDPDYEFRNVPVVSSSSLKNNGSGERIYLENGGQSHRHSNAQTAIIDNAATTQTEPCHSASTSVPAIVVITLSVFAVCFEVFTIACTGLKEESPISLSFWSYIFCIRFSLFFSFSVRSYSHSRQHHRYHTLFWTCCFGLWYYIL